MSGLAEDRAVLKLALKLISPRGTWIKYRNAVDASRYGYAVSPRDPSACKFCLQGAIVAAGHRLDADIGGPMERVKSELPRQSNGSRSSSITEYNDRPSRRRGDVLNLLRRTIRGTS
jgi:hypothetical protein